MGRFLVKAYSFFVIRGFILERGFMRVGIAGRFFFMLFFLVGISLFIRASTFLDVTNVGRRLVKVYIF